MAIIAGARSSIIPRRKIWTSWSEPVSARRDFVRLSVSDSIHRDNRSPDLHCAGPVFRAPVNMCSEDISGDNAADIDGPVEMESELLGVLGVTRWVVRNQSRENSD